MKMIRLFVTFFLVIGFGATAFGGSTAINLGGRLTETNGKPVQGPIDLQVKFFDADEDGSQLGPTKVIPNVVLSQGAFQVEVDLLPSDRQTIIGSAGAVYVEFKDVDHDVVYPRQKFSAVPYALRVPVDSVTIGFNANGELEVQDVSGVQQSGVLLDGGANDVTIKAATGSDPLTLTLPNTVGTSGYVLTTDGTTGALTWTSKTSAGGGDMLSTNNLGDVTNAATARTNLGIGNVTNTNVLNSYTQNDSQYIGTDEIRARDVGGLKLLDDGANGIFVQDGGNVGIGTLLPGASLEVAGQVKITGGTPGVGQVLTSDGVGLATWEAPVATNWAVPGAIGATTPNSGVFSYLSSDFSISTGSSAMNTGLPGLGTVLNITGRTMRDADTVNGGTAASHAASLFGAPTLTSLNGGVTTTDAYTAMIVGAPINSATNTATNAIALGVKSANVGAQTNSYGLKVEAQTGAAANYAAAFTGGNVGIGTSSPAQRLSVAGTLGLLETGATPSRYTVFQAGDQTVDITYTLPTAAPTVNGQVLSGATNGVLSWVAQPTAPVTSVNTQSGVVVLDTDDVLEGTNKYFTDALARGALAPAAPLTWNSGTGALGVDVGTGGAQVAAGNHSHADATTGASGLMSGADKTSLNGMVTNGLVDGDFGTDGIMVRTGAGVYNTIADDSGEWDAAYTDRLKWDGGPTGLNATTGRGSLGAAASGANSDITSLTGLTTALSVGQGGTGATTLTGLLKGNGTGAFTAAVAGTDYAAANALAASDGTPAQALYVDAGGNVGVGTTTPTTFRLEVAGDIGPTNFNDHDLGGVNREWGQIHGINYHLRDSGGTNRVAMMSSASNLLQVGSAFSMTSIGGDVGIGTTSPSHKLEVAGNALVGGHLALGSNAAVDDMSLLLGGGASVKNVLSIQETVTDMSPDGIVGITNHMLLDPAAAPVASVVATHSVVETAASNVENFSSLTGDSTYIFHKGSGTLGSGVGAQTSFNHMGSAAVSSGAGVTATVSNESGGTIVTASGISASATNGTTGTITSAHAGLFGVSNSGGTITNGYGILISPAWNSGGTFTNNYGLYVSDQSAVGSTSSFNVYSAGASSKNYFAGNVGIGTTDPLSKLSVNGTIESTTGGVKFPDGSTQTTAASTSCFNGGYMQVEERYADGTDGIGLAAGSWVTRVLNTVVVNQIAGASFTTPTVTLPAGTYYAWFESPAYQVDEFQSRLRQVTDGVTLIPGSTEIAPGSAVASTSSGAVLFTLAVAKGIQVQHFGEAAGGLVYNDSETLSGEPEVGARLYICKVL